MNWRRGRNAMMGKRSVLVVGAMAGLLLAGGSASSALGQDTIVIRADGPDVSNSAAGADNVRVEANPGRRQVALGQGQGNQEIRRAPRPNREQNRDRDRSRNNRDQGGEAAAPASAPAPAPVPVAEATEAQPVAESNVAQGSETQPIALPSTGAGLIDVVPRLVALLSGGAIAAGAGWSGRRRQQR